MTRKQESTAQPGLQLPLADEAATVDLGRHLGEVVCRGGYRDKSLIIYLQGDLGAGKTTLARGFLRAFGYTGAVKSPTYTLLEPYLFLKPAAGALSLKPAAGAASKKAAERNIYHFDLYRLAHPEEVDFLGAEGCFCAPHISLIEWPEQGGERIPPADLLLELHLAGRTRSLHATGRTPAGADICKALKDYPPQAET